MGGMLIDRTKANGAELVRATARRIARTSPKLADLSETELVKLARVVMAEGLKNDLRRAADLERIDYQAERRRFLDRASRTGSTHTRRAYQTALDRLDSWCARQGMTAVELSPAQADDWIEAEKAEGLSPASVRLHVAGASAFWTWLERRHAELRSPFRGSRARPIAKPRRSLAVPPDAEIGKLEQAAGSTLRAAIVAMAHAGLRVGALPSLSVTGGAWKATTKGREQSGVLPAEVRGAIEKAGLPLRSPFGGMSAGQIADAFRYQSAKLHREGELQARYSVHDLRHAFAVRLYKSTHDVYQVKQALGHANVTVTEKYLRSLGV
jgi:site-specific recombinase XerD